MSTYLSQSTYHGVNVSVYCGDVHQELWDNRWHNCPLDIVEYMFSKGLPVYFRYENITGIITRLAVTGDILFTCYSDNNLYKRVEYTKSGGSILSYYCETMANYHKYDVEVYGLE